MAMVTSMFSKVTSWLANPSGAFSKTDPDWDKIDAATQRNALHRAVLEGDTKTLSQLVIQRKQLLESYDSDYNTPLLLAVEKGHREACDILLKAGANANARDKDGLNSLDRAVLNDKVEIVRLLADQHKELLDIAMYGKKAPLLSAAEKGHLAVCEILLNAGANIKTTDAYQANVLHCAAFSGKVEVVQLFIERKESKELLESHDGYGNTPLLLSAEKGHLAVCESLLKNGASRNATNKNYGSNILHAATCSGKAGVMQLFVQQKELLESKDANGKTPLFWAAERGSVVACEVLLNANADASTPTPHGNVLHFAVSGGKAEVIQLFARKKQLLNSGGKTPLMLAAEKGDRAACEILLNAGADVNPTNGGLSALSYAVHSDKPELVQLFINWKDLKNELIDHQDTNGETPLLRWAHSCSNLSIYKILVDAGANVNVKGNLQHYKLERTILHYGAMNKKAEVVKLLVQQHIKFLEAEDSQGDTPLLIAAQYGSKEGCDALLQAGAKADVRNKEGYNAILLAAKNHNKGVLGVLAKQKHLLETQDNYGNTPLFWAASTQENFKILLDAGANKKAKNHQGRTVLHTAASNSYSQGQNVEHLAKDKELLESEDNYGNTPLISAAESGHLAACEILLQAGAKKAAASKYNGNALHAAVRSGKLEVVQRFICPELLESQDNSGNTPLLLAIESGHKEIAQVLLKAGADKNAKSKDGRNILHMAAQSGKVELVNAVFQQKLLESQDNLGNTPLLSALMRGHKEASEILMEKGANKSAKDNDGRSTLYWSVAHNIEKFVYLFIQDKQLLEWHDKEGNTPLLVAARSSYRVMCEILLKAKANVNATNKAGWNVLHMAAYAGAVELVQLFKEQKQLLETCDIEHGGNTPLLWAAAGGHRAACEILLQAGAKIDARNKGGKDALELAQAGNKLDVVELLTKYKKSAQELEKQNKNANAAVQPGSNVSSTQTIQNNPVNQKNFKEKEDKSKETTSHVTPSPVPVAPSVKQDNAVSQRAPSASSQAVALDEETIKKLKELPEKHEELAKKLAAIDATTLQLIQKHVSQLPHLFEMEDKEASIQREQALIDRSPALQTYHHFFSRLLTGTWMACQSINSGMIDNDEMSTTDYIGKGLDKIGEKVPGINIVTGVISGGISAWNYRDKKKAVQRMALLFPDLPTAFTELGKLARQVTQAQTKTISSIKVPEGIIAKIREKAKSVKNFMLAEDADTPLKRQAIEDCQKLLIAIKEGKLPHKPTMTDFMKAIMGEKFEYTPIIAEPAKPNPTVITSPSSNSSVSSPPTVSPTMEEMLKKVEQLESTIRLMNEKLSRAVPPEETEVGSGNQAQKLMSMKSSAGAASGYSLLESAERNNELHTRLLIHHEKLEEHGDQLLAQTHELQQLQKKMNSDQGCCTIL